MRKKLGFIGLNDLEGVEADARFAVEHGFEGLEYNFWDTFRDLTADTVRAMRDTLDKHGASCSMLGLWGWNHLSPDEADRAEAHEMLSRAIGFAEVLGAGGLHDGRRADPRRGDRGAGRGVRQGLPAVPGADRGRRHEAGDVRRARKQLLRRDRGV